MTLKIFTLQDIRAFSPAPCYEPTRYLAEGWAGTALDILAVQACPALDRLWVVCREDVLSERILRRFAVACARAILASIPYPDARGVMACAVAGLYASGKATVTELDAAYAAAEEAAQQAGADVLRLHHQLVDVRFAARLKVQALQAAACAARRPVHVALPNDAGEAAVNRLIQIIQQEG